MAGMVIVLSRADFGAVAFPRRLKLHSPRLGLLHHCNFSYCHRCLVYCELRSLAVFRLHAVSVDQGKSV